MRWLLENNDFEQALQLAGLSYIAWVRGRYQAAADLSSAVISRLREIGVPGNAGQVCSLGASTKSSTCTTHVTVPASLLVPCATSASCRLTTCANDRAFPYIAAAALRIPDIPGRA